MQEYFDTTGEWHATIEDMFGVGDMLVVREAYRYKQISTGKTSKGGSIVILYFKEGLITEAWECSRETVE